MSRVRPRIILRATATTSARVGALCRVFIVRQGCERLAERGFPAMVVRQALDHAGDVGNDFVWRKRRLVETGRPRGDQLVGEGARDPKSAAITLAEEPVFCVIHFITRLSADDAN